MDAAYYCSDPLWICLRETAMDEYSVTPTAGRLQQLLAERLRQRYSQCRESLANHAGESATQMEPADKLPQIVARMPRKSDAVRAPAARSTECFSTLFSQAYSAARDSQESALASILDRRKQHLAA